MEKIAVYPGGFKPPHGGHYEAAKYLIEGNDADSVLVIVGPKERDGITMEDAIKIWDIYRQNDTDPRSKRINIVAAQSPTPVRDVYELVEHDLPHGSSVYLGVGQKETDGRWDNIRKFADPKNINFKIVPIPPQVGGISGTQMRELIDNGDKEAFIEYLPKHLSAEEIDQVWDLLFKVNEVLDEGVRDFVKKNASNIKNLIQKFRDAWHDQQGDFKGYKDLVLKYLNDKESLTSEEKVKLQRNTTDILKTAGITLAFPVMGFSGTIFLAFLVKRMTGGKHTTLPSQMGKLLDKGPKEEELNEGKQVGKLYHYTTLDNLSKIIKSNSLHPGHTGHGEFNYVSTTRSKEKDQFGISETSDVVLVLDGDKISHNHKIIPHHDIETGEYDDITYTDKEGNQIGVPDWDKWDGDGEKGSVPMKRYGAFDEMEELIVGGVYPLDKFLLKVILYKTNDKIKILLKSKNIPYEVKTDLDEFMAGMMTNQEMEKHKAALARLNKAFDQQGNKYMPVPDNTKGTLTRKLFEGKQVGILYHNTYNDLQTIKSIIDQNTLKKGINGTVSLARVNDKEVYFTFTGGSNDSAILVIDGDKLSHNYKIEPFRDKWGGMIDQETGREVDEFEERVKRDITNLNRYLIKILLPPNDPETENIKKYLDSKDIPYEDIPPNILYERTPYRKEPEATKPPVDDYKDKPIKVIINETKKSVKMREDLGFDYWYEHFSNQIHEGGAAGHMKHPFELDSVNNSSDLVKVFKDAYNSVKNGNSSLKIDGINASIRLANIEGKRQFVMDRGTKKELDLRGITQDDLEDRFGAGHGLVKIGGEILPLFNEYLPQIKSELISLGMWDNPYITFNMEYVDGQTNVQEYDSKFLAIHGLLELKFVEKENSRGTYQKRISQKLPYSKEVLESLVKKLNQNKQGFKVYDTVGVKTTSIPNLNSALSKQYTIIDDGKKVSKSLLQWLKSVNRIPKTQRVRISDEGGGKTVNALSKQVYLGIFGQKDISQLFKNSDERSEALKAAITYLATERLGEAVLDSLDSPMGRVNEHEGIVISDPKIDKGTTFKITGNFITRGMNSHFKEAKIVGPPYHVGGDRESDTPPYNTSDEYDYSNFYTSDTR